MIPLTLQEVAAATGGRLGDGTDPQVSVTGPVTVDSRTVEPGSLFVAVRGERADGHAFAGRAGAAGAVATLATKPVEGPAVYVADAVEALAALARAVLARLPDARVTGVTGSSGKTTTKDLLAQLLARLGPTVAPPGSYNNEYGLPLTVLRADSSTRFLALEYSARGVGHIRYLTGIARPQVAAVLNVGSAHLGEFGSREKVAEAKGELVEALGPDGVAVLNGDDPLVLAMAGRTRARVVTTGEGPDAAVRATDVRLNSRGGAEFTLHAAGAARPVALGLIGRHQVGNCLSAAAIALECGLDLDQVAAGLSEARPLSRWRMEVSERADGVTVLNDAYNANPESVRAALDALVSIAGGGRRSWAVLGEMAELGAAAPGAHELIGRYAVECGVARVIAVGPGAAQVYAGARAASEVGERVGYVRDAEAALAALSSELAPGDVVLVKASRAVGLERVALALLEEAPA